MKTVQKVEQSFFVPGCWLGNSTTKKIHIGRKVTTVGVGKLNGQPLTRVRHVPNCRTESQNHWLWDHGPTHPNGITCKKCAGQVTMHAVLAIGNNYAWDDLTVDGLAILCDYLRDAGDVDSLRYVERYLETYPAAFINHQGANR